MSKTPMKVLRHIQYGRERFYPGCKLTRAICTLTEKKTLDETAITILTGIGNCDVEIETVKKRPKD